MASSAERSWVGCKRRATSVIAGQMLLPPHQIFENFLTPAEHGSLLDFVLTNRERFAAATVYNDGVQVVSQSQRTSEKLAGGLGPLKDMFLDRVKENVSAMFGGAGIQEKPVVRYETELVAHRDGGRFGRHIDTLTGANKRDDDSPGYRTVSCVYYFYRQPRAFTGGQLRLFTFGSDDHVDIEPLENAFLVFPSFAAHEVRPVTCPSGVFEDSRFSVNCWLHCSVG